MKYDTEIHHRRSIRLKGYDYTQIGLYYITLCCQNRECIFGEIFNGEMVLNEYGKIVDKCWRDLPIHYQNIQLDYFVIMPNHFHGIVIIDTIVGAGFKPALTNTDKPAPTNHGLSEFIRALKTFSSKQINQIRNTPGISVWQRNPLILIILCGIIIILGDYLMKRQNNEIVSIGRGVALQTDRQTDIV